MFKELGQFIKIIGDRIYDVISPPIQGYISPDLDTDGEEPIECDIHDIERLYKDAIITKEQRDELIKDR